MCGLVGIFDTHEQWAAVDPELPAIGQSDAEAVSRNSTRLKTGDNRFLIAASSCSHSGSEWKIENETFNVLKNRPLGAILRTAAWQGHSAFRTQKRHRVQGVG